MERGERGGEQGLAGGFIPLAPPSQLHKAIPQRGMPAPQALFSSILALTERLCPYTPDREWSSLYFSKGSDGLWQQVQKLVASDREDEDWFGRSVAISGSYAIVGARQEDENVTGGDSLENAGAAYIFERRANGNWEEVAKAVASDRAEKDGFGESVSIYGPYAIIQGIRYHEVVRGSLSLEKRNQWELE